MAKNKRKNQTLDLSSITLTPEMRQEIDVLCWLLDPEEGNSTREKIRLLEAKALDKFPKPTRAQMLEVRIKLAQGISESEVYGDLEKKIRADQGKKYETDMGR